MFIVNTETIPGKDLEVLGLVQGSMIQSKHVGKDIMSGLKTIVGGELKGYTQMLEEAREIAMKRMLEKAQNFGADAVINVRFSTSAIVQGAAEILVYGTAVKYK